MSRNYAGTTALITGASSGIGVEIARGFAQRGADVVLVARRKERLEELATELRAAHRTRAIVSAKDLTDPAAPRELAAELESQGVSIDSLVNNAGFGMFGALVESDPAKTDAQIRLNISALVSLTRQFLPQLTASGRGALINVASTAAYQPLPYMAVYGASKAFVLSFTEALAFETRGSGLRVTALSPGATTTEFFDVVGTDDAVVGAMKTPRQVADLAFRAIESRRTPPSIISGRRNRALATLTQLLPRKMVLNLSGNMMRAEGKK